MRRFTVVVVAVLLAGLLAAPASAHHRPGHGKGGGGSGNYGKGYYATGGPVAHAFLGCSLTTNTADGYNRLYDTGLSGGKGANAVIDWANNSRDTRKDWDQMENIWNDRTIVGDWIWVQFCNRTSDPGTTQDHRDRAVTMLNRMAARHPGVPIYISATPEYVNVEGCNNSSRHIGLDQIDYVLNNPALTTNTVEAGPVIGPLYPEHVRGNGDCHYTEHGDEYTGAQVRSFFG